MLQCSNRLHQEIQTIRKELKNKVYAQHGGYVCACCGETNEDFLSIDHIIPLKVSGKKREGLGADMYYYLARENYPSGYQILCMNCNHAKMRIGRCRCQDNKVYEPFTFIT